MLKKTGHVAEKESIAKLVSIIELPKTEIASFESLPESMDAEQMDAEPGKDESMQQDAEVGKDECIQQDPAAEKIEPESDVEFICMQCQCPECSKTPEVDPPIPSAAVGGQRQETKPTNCTVRHPVLACGCLRGRSRGSSPRTAQRRATYPPRSRL